MKKKKLKKYDFTKKDEKRVIRKMEMEGKYPLGLSAEDAAKLLFGKELEDLPKDIQEVMNRVYDRESIAFAPTRKAMFNSEWEAEITGVLAAVMLNERAVFDLIVRSQFEQHIILDRMNRIERKLNMLLDNAKLVHDDIDELPMKIPEEMPTAHSIFEQLFRQPSQPGPCDRLPPFVHEDEDSSEEDEEDEGERHYSGFPDLGQTVTNRDIPPHNEIQRAYTTAYKRMQSKAKRGAITEETFAAWKDAARRKREEVADPDGKLTWYEYCVWLNADKNVIKDASDQDSESD